MRPDGANKIHVYHVNASTKPVNFDVMTVRIIKANAIENMTARKTLLLFTFIGMTLTNYSQALDISKYNQEKENALNFVINSPQFDSIYSAKRVYFVANEILPKSSPIILKKNGRRVRVLDNSNLTRRGLDYINLGDFTMIGENPNYARVQLECYTSQKLFNVMLKKENGKWVFDNYLIMDN